MNTRRRLLLQYRQVHNEKLKRDIGDSEEQIFDCKSLRDFHDTTFQSSTQDFYFGNIKNFEVQSFSDNVSSFASTQMGEQLSMFSSSPKGPNGENLEDFICSYCCVICYITSSHGWKRHVLNDFEPYVCTFENCVQTNDRFQTREDWYNHEIQQHRLDYSCNVENHQEYSDIREFKSHMNKEHNIQIDNKSIQSQLSMFSRSTRHKSGVCPFCMKSTKHLKGYLARHLERIALYALPRDPHNEVQPSDDDTSKESVVLDSLTSKPAPLSPSLQLSELSVRAPQAFTVNLECPFNFLRCLMTYSNFEEWITHSLEHFGKVDPPKLNSCYFCDETFSFPSGHKSWRERMQHVALHHRFGHKLADVNLDFQLFNYLWGSSVISTAEYKHIIQDYKNSLLLEPNQIETLISKNSTNQERTIQFDDRINFPKDENLPNPENSAETREVNETGLYSNRHNST